MKSIIILIISTLLIYAGNAQEISGLFYCNAQYNFEKIQVINKDWFFGWQITENNNRLISEIY